MLKKEFKEVSVQTFFFITIMLLATFVKFIESLVTKSPFHFFSSIFPLFQFGILFMAFFFGISIFSSEIRQGGIGYLLSFPFSRLKLLEIKMFPRAIAVAIFYFLYLLLHFMGGRNSSIMAIISFTGIYFVIFFMSLSFSAVRENFLVNAITVMFVFFGFLALIYVVYSIGFALKGYGSGYFRFLDIFMADGSRDEPGLTFFVLLFLTLPFILAFVLTFRRFDIRPGKIFNQRYFKIFVPTFIIGVILALFFAYTGIGNPYCFYYLTQEHKLIESSDNTFIYDEENKLKLKEDYGIYFYGSIEDDRNIYFPNWYHGPDRIDAFNKTENHIDTLYKPKRNSTVGNHLYKYRSIVIATEFKKKGKLNNLQVPVFILIDINTRAIKKIKPKYIIDRKYQSLLLFGVYEESESRTWLVFSQIKGGTGNKIIGIREDGMVKQLGESEIIPQYVNNLLITFDNKDLIFEKITPDGKMIITRIPANKAISFYPRYWFHSNLNPVEVKYLYGDVPNLGNNKREKFVILDLENFKIKELKTDFLLEGYFSISHPDIAYFISRDFNKHLIKALYKIEGDQIDLLKKFENFKLTEKRSFLRTFKSGLIISKQGKISVYSLPDLKELKFKKL